LERTLISEALDYIRVEVRDYLSVTDAEVSTGHLHSLSSDALNPGVRIALVNVGQETTTRNAPHVVRNASGLTEYQEPPVYLNCHLMFAFDFSAYQTNMIRLSETIELFQSKRFFDASNERPANPFPSGLDRLVFDMCSPEFEQLNHIWGVLGGVYLPSILYKVRLLKIQSDQTIAGPEVTSLHVQTGFKRK
jgi:hypothetical protein